MLTQLPSVPSLIPSSFATLAIGRDVSITIFTASSLNSGEKLFFGRGNFLPFQVVYPNGWTVRKVRGGSLRVVEQGLPVGELAGGEPAGDGLAADLAGPLSVRAVQPGRGRGAAASRVCPS